MNAITTVARPAATQEDLIAILSSSLYPGAKPESIRLVLAYCHANNLDPFLKPVHIVPTSIKLPSGRYEMRDVLMPGIADYRIKAARSGEYGGKTEPEFGPDVTETIDNVRVTYPAWCRVTIRRIVQGQAREFSAKELWLENYATAGRDTEAPNKMWKKRPYGQLAKCAESQALRMAFPEFSAGYTAEEMEGKTPFDGTTIEAETPRPVSQTPVSSDAAKRDTADAEQTKPAKRSYRQLIDETAGMLAACEDLDAVAAVGELPAVLYALEHGNAAVKDELNVLLAKAYATHRTEADPGLAEALADDFPGDRA